MRHGFEAVFAPAPGDHADLMAALDGQPHLLAVRVDDGIACGQFAQLALPPHGGDKTAGAGLDRADVGCMQEHEPAGAEGVQRQFDGLANQEDAGANFERQAPGNSGAGRRVRSGLRHRRGHGLLR